VFECVLIEDILCVRVQCHKVNKLQRGIICTSPCVPTIQSSPQILLVLLKVQNMITIPKNIPTSVALIAISLTDFKFPPENPADPLVSSRGATETDALGALVTKLPATAVEVVTNVAVAVVGRTGALAPVVLNVPIIVVLTVETVVEIVVVEQSVQELQDVHSTSHSLLSHVPLVVQPGQFGPGHLSSGQEPEPHGPAVPVGHGPLSYQVCVPLVLQ